jgi:hypothetical protein
MLTDEQRDRLITDILAKHSEIKKAYPYSVDLIVNDNVVDILAWLQDHKCNCVIRAPLIVDDGPLLHVWENSVRFADIYLWSLNDGFDGFLNLRFKDKDKAILLKMSF